MPRGLIESLIIGGAHSSRVKRWLILKLVGVGVGAGEGWAGVLFLKVASA